MALASTIVRLCGARHAQAKKKSVQVQTAEADILYDEQRGYTERFVRGVQCMHSSGARHGRQGNVRFTITVEETSFRLLSTAAIPFLSRISVPL
jgi:hypothetical protein